MFFWISGNCFSQDPCFKFSRISTEDGLSASWVRTFYQDKYGFIWFGTSDGLNRYDGYEMEVYKPADTENSIINGDIHYLSERADGLVWICTNQGVSLLDIDKKIFSTFPYLNNIRVTHVMEDNKGRSWFATFAGVYLFDPSDSTIRNFQHDPADPASLISNEANRVYQDQNSEIWIATQKGLDRYLPGSSSFEHYNSAEEERKLSGQVVRDIISDSNGNLWVAIADRGIDLLLAGEKGAVKEIRREMIKGYPNSMFLDRESRLWIANSMEGGVYLLDLESISPDTIQYKRIIGETPSDWSLSDNTISKVYQDRYGGIWIGTFAGGVNYHSPYLKQFNCGYRYPGNIPALGEKVINCFLDDGRYFWIGSEEGLGRFEPDKGEFTMYKHDPEDPNSLGSSGVICLFKDSRSNLWVGTWNGSLNQYNYTKDNFRRFVPDENVPGTINNNNIFAIHEDRRGNLWIATNGGGLNKYDYHTGEFMAYLPETDNPESIYHNAVNDICETDDGELFVSVYHSLELFDYDSETFRHYIHNPEDDKSLSDGIILDIFEDSRGNLWIGTSTGINLMNRKDGTFRRYGVKDGLPNNTVQAIAEDDHGNLWLSTNNGICKFRNAISVPDTAEFISYHVTDGLSGNEYVRRSVYRHEDGWLYFGGTRGYTYFHPDRINKNPQAPQIAITDFSLLKNSQEEKDLEYEGEINLLDRLDLDYNQSDFIIEFAALNYINPRLNRYRFILEGYDKQWRDVEHQREVTYTNIDPGKYVFKIMGCNNDGVWCKEPKTLEIVIHPSWWGTWLFRILMVSLGLIIIYLIFRLRLRWLQQQKKTLEEGIRNRTQALSELNTLLEEKQEEITLQNEELSEHRANLEKQVEDRTMVMKEALRRAEEADKLKSAFLANMSHEIRTPMNAIVGFAALLNNEDIDDEERINFTEIISNNCNSLMVLINDILEVSLIEANQIEIKSEPFNVFNIFKELESYFLMNNHKDLKIKFIRSKEDTALFIRGDSIRFRQIFNNLINNAYKYTEKGSIEFGYKHENSEIIFYVSDTGIGIAESEYENIFNFFHKIDRGDNQFYRGAGIGLSISNKLAELMGGRIWLESSPGKGTTFHVSFNDIVFEERLSSDQQERVQEKQSLPDLSQKTIVVAEDESANYYLIEKILKNTRATLIWARNGKEAVEAVRELENKGDCMVIMDIKMPVMNGIRAAEEIRKINPDIPVIAVTAYAQTQNREKILKENFVDYVAKPLKPQLLIEVLRNHMN